MADVWFIKRDDEKTGPYTSAQLRQMASTGQLQPIDLVTKGDADNWVPAANVKGLFAPPTSTPAPPPLPVDEEWHYSQGGSQLGPVGFGVLKEMATAGRLKSADLVWKAGMPGWVAASSVPDLFRPIKVAPPPLPAAGTPTAPSASTSTAMAITARAFGGEASYTVVMDPYTGRKASNFTRPRARRRSRFRCCHSARAN